MRTHVVLILWLGLGVAVSAGQNPADTATDWDRLHRETAQQVELATQRRDYLRASVLASLQDGYFRSLEQDYAAALRSALMALELHRKSGVRANLALSLTAVARDYRSLGEPLKALPYYQEALAAVEDRASKKAGEIWLDLVRAWIEGNDFQAGREEAARMMEATQAGAPLLLGNAFLAQCEVAFAAKEYDAGLTALKAAQEAGADPLAVSVRLLTVVLFSMSSLSHDETLRLARRMEVEFPDLPVPIASFARKAVQMRQRMAGGIDAVLREQLQALESERAQGNQRAQAEILLGMAATYRALNSRRNELATMRQAVLLDQNWRALNGLGEAYLWVGETTNARRAFDDVIRGIEGEGAALARDRAADDYGRALLGKAEVAVKEDDPDGGREILRKALAGGVPGARFVREDVVLQLARLERGDRKWGAAKARYEEAIGAFHQVHKGFDELAARIEFAHFLAVEPSFPPTAREEAGRQIERARESARLLNAAESEWRCHYEAGVLAEAQGDAASAGRWYQLALARLEVIRGGLNLEEQRRSLVDSETVQDLHRRMLALHAGESAGKVWELMERAKARAFRDALQGRRWGTVAKTAPAGTAALEQRIASLRVVASDDNASLLRTAGREPVSVQRELRALESRLALELEQEKLTKTRAGQAVSSAALPLSRVRQLLPEGTAIVEFGMLNDGILAVVVTRAQVTRVRIAVKPTALKASVRQLRTLLADGGSTVELRQAIERVSAMIWEPVEGILPSGVERLLMVPAGPLCYLPFSVLETAGKQPLLERYTIAYLPAASLLELLPRRAVPVRNLFLGALGDVSVGGMPGLPGTLRETEDIARIYGKAGRASGEAFTHDVARKALLDYEAVHFATHGTSEQLPLFSALLTAPAAGQPSQLSLYEISQLELKARLVVLSACETGLGEFSGGDEVLGLTRTFLLAGADTVVSSLWKVSDESTAPLMRAFYERLRNGAPPARALKEAAMAVRSKYPHPFHWAAFIVTGAN